MNFPILTLQQPWADAVMRYTRRKDIENRSWDTEHRGLLGIHSGLRVDRTPRLSEHDSDEGLRGFILGTVQLVGTHIADGDECQRMRCITNAWAHWAKPGERPLWHWQVEQPRRFVSPIPAKGRLKLWEAGPSIDYLCEIADVVESSVRFQS